MKAWLLKLIVFSLIVFSSATLVFASDETSQSIRERLSKIEEICLASHDDLESAGFASLRNLKELIDLGKTATPYLKEIISDKSKDWKLRFLSMEILTEIDSKEVILPLSEIIENTSEKVELRAQAATLLGKTKNTEVLEILLPYLNDENNLVRRNVCNALGNIGDIVAVPVLVETLSDEDEITVINAARALGKIGGPEAVEPLIALLVTTKSNLVKMHVAIALGEIKDKKAVEPIISELGKMKDIERVHLIEALGKIGDKRATEVLKIELNSYEEIFAIYAEKALKEMGIEEVTLRGNPVKGDKSAGVPSQKSENAVLPKTQSDSAPICFEIGDAIHREGTYTSDAGHAGVFIGMGSGENPEDWSNLITIEALGYGVGVKENNFYNFYYAEDVIDAYTGYWGSSSLPIITKTHRQIIVSTAYAQIGCGYDFFGGYKDPINRTFRCDGLVEYCYEVALNQTGVPGNNGGIVQDDTWVTLSPLLQFANMNPRLFAIPPTCSITYPEEGITVTGIVTIRADAYDADSGIKFVKFQYSLDNNSWHTTPSPDSPSGKDTYEGDGWSLRFDTIAAGITDEDVYLRCMAVDKAGNYSYSSSYLIHVDNTGINVTVNLAPSSCKPSDTVNVSGNATYLLGGTVTAGTVTITVSGSTYTTNINSDGSYSRNITAPNSSCYVYVTVSDGTRQGSNSAGLDIIGPTYVCGTIYYDTTWSQAHSPYVVTCGITVPQGVTLTIEPGVIVKIQPVYNAIYVYGTLIADGTPDQKIVFTSIKDDSYGGDTNGDVNGSSPAGGDWVGIRFYSGSVNSVLDNAVVAYSGRQDGYHEPYDYCSIYTVSSSLTCWLCIYYHREYHK
ncbi:MAG: HEAT repeat domain-containing protein [Proteobacteria bacterium]|nr:HEAT repeat domain-containing protein [Pseudomonadota bacterium]